ncbi:MAG: PorP/SprF family type IX secretion system membrane protein [Vicingaceae bacterium]|nr:PorP/SprF family type IX secretion system membrane protein [Vicingaceae bacterium]
MREIKLIGSVLLFVGFISMKVVAQDVHFSQFGQTPQLINPAATGVFEGNVRAFLNYRTQWTGIGKGFRTYAASFDAPLRFKKGRRRNQGAYLGLGLNFYNDVAGTSNFGSSQTSISVSGILPISEQHKFSLGIQTGLGQNSVNLSSLTWGNQYNGLAFDTQLATNELYGLRSSQYLDLGAGVFYEFKTEGTSFLSSDVSSFNVGVAGYHLNEPAQEFLAFTTDNLPMKIVAQFSGTFDLGLVPLSLVPSVFYATQASSKEITPGMLLKFRRGHETKYSGMFKEAAIYFGAHYRVGDAIIPEIYLEFTDYMIGFSYDYSNSDLAKSAGGANGIEFSIRYIHQNKALQRASFR